MQLRCHRVRLLSEMLALFAGVFINVLVFSITEGQKVTRDDGQEKNITNDKLAERLPLMEQLLI